MKNLLPLLFALIIFPAFSQISVNRSHIGFSEDFDEGIIEAFKNSETIFVLSNIFTTEEYESILVDAWDVTEYEIVDYEDYDPKDYVEGKYSIVQLSGYTRTTTSSTGTVSSVTRTYVDIILFDSEDFKATLEELPARKRASYKEDIIANSTVDIARFYIDHNEAFIKTIISGDDKDIFYELYNNEISNNYNLGFLKNYFQKINDLLKKEEIYWAFKDEYLPELKKLAKDTLFIPSYVTKKYNPMKGTFSEESNAEMMETLSKYKYNYKIVPVVEIEDKILDNEEFYYLRYVIISTERFIQIVNGKTGEVVYRDYVAGVSYKLKPKHIITMSNKVKKAARK